jgi:predicted transcriptional regulator of viral defense system
MPKRATSGTVPDWNKLSELAVAQAGYITNAEADSAGYSPRLIQFYVNKGRLERAARGILRLVHFPASDIEHLVPVWLWSKREGVFSHETALMLHDLSDALPAKRHVTVPLSWKGRRLRVPRGISLHFGDVPKQGRTWIDAVPVTTPLQTTLDCVRDHVQPDLVEQAIAQAVKRGLFKKSDLKRAMKDVGVA